MENPSKSLPVLVLTALLALGVASCGDGGDADSTTAPTSAAQRQGGETAATTPADAGKTGESESESERGEGSAGTNGSAKSHEDSGDGSAQFRVRGGDNSVQDFGAEAGESELGEAAAALHGFLDARAARDWATACDYVSGDIVESLRQLATRSKQLRDKGCPQLLAALTGGVSQAALAEAAEADVGALRIEDDRAFLLYHGARNTDYTMPMASEDGSWKVAALAGTPLN